MEEKRYLTDEELKVIRNHKDMLEGNINRMCVTDDVVEFYRMFDVALSRINSIKTICFNKFIDED